MKSLKRNFDQNSVSKAKQLYKSDFLNFPDSLYQANYNVNFKLSKTSINQSIKRPFSEDDMAKFQTKPVLDFVLKKSV